MNTRRWPRFPFIAIVYASDLALKIGVAARTSDLSKGGCYVDAVNPLPKDMAVKVEIVHNGKSFLAEATVVYSQPDKGMGISFLRMEEDMKLILENWLEELCSSSPPVPS